MRRITLGLLTLTLLAAPVAARAGFLFEGSVGTGLRAGIGSAERIPTNLMATVGYGFAGMLKLEVGALFNLGDVGSGYAVGGSEFDVDLRPMIVLSPPLLPFYLRGIAGVASLKVQPVTFTYGAALGAGFGLFGIGGFVEAGAMQHRYQIATPLGSVSKDGWQIEARLGLSIG